MATPTALRPTDAAPKRQSVATSLQRWLTGDYAPLDGRVRIVFFVLVLVVGARFMLTTVPDAVRAVPAELYDGAGLFGLLVDDRGVALTMVEVLRVPVVLAIVLSAVGLGGRLPMLFAGLGSFLMVGAYLSGTGTGHSWYVAIVAMVVLGLTHQPTAWSLDGMLARRWRRYPFGRGERDTSAVGLKLILIYAVFTLFADGCAKLLEAGWRWMDGESVRFYLIQHGAPKGAIGRALTDLVLDHMWVAVAISVLAVVVELGALLTLFAPGVRLLYFAVLAAGFHLATYLLMLPEFFPQLVTYVLLVEWARVEWRRPWVRRPAAVTTSGRTSSAPLAIATVAMAAVVLGASIAGRIEWYPLTNIPMYSSYVNGEEISGLPIETFGDEARLCAEANALRSRTRPWYARFYVADRLLLRSGSAPAGGVEELAASVSGGSRFWLDELGKDVLDELPCGEGGLARGAAMPHTATALAALRDELGSTQRLELLYPFDDGTTAVLAVAGGPP